MHGLGYACALVLAGVFVRAGAAKLARPAATSTGFAALGLPGAGVLARAVPITELAVALCLVAAPRPGGVAALVALSGFSVALARALRSGTTVPCNCFGAARADPVSAADVVRNALLAVLALAALGAPGPTLPGPPAVLAATAAAGAGCLALAALRRRRRATA